MSQNKVPTAMKEKYEEIMKLIIDFSDRYLNEEYIEMSSKLTAALSRKRPSPLLKGKSNVWACGIIHAIGMVNFLFDSTQAPHMKAGELYESFQVSNSTGSLKSKEIRDMMKMTVLDTEWTIPSKMNENPLAWIVNFNGTPMDIRHASKKMQQIAFSKGLIPYIPDQEEEEENIDYSIYGNVIPFKRANKIENETIDRKEKYKMAQALMFEAWQTINPKKRIELARKAIGLSKYCSDAYILIAQESDLCDEDKKELYEKALKAGEDIIGKKDLKKCRGKFWEIPKTRPYMRAKFQLANLLWEMGEAEEAVKHCQEMLQLNPNDDQGVRGVLINWLIFRNKCKQVESLLNDYNDDFLCSMIYSKALFLFRKGDFQKASKALSEAIERNKFVPLYLLQFKDMPEVLPEYVGFGDENEAIAYVYDAFQVWYGIPGAIEWLDEKFHKELT